MTFQEKLVILRKTRGLTQDEFASAVGVSRQAVYKWESGQSYPEVQKLLEIKTLFSISIDDLLDDNYDVPLPEKKRRKRISKETKEKIEKSVENEESIPAPSSKKVPSSGAPAPVKPMQPTFSQSEIDEEETETAAKEDFTIAVKEEPKETPKAETKEEPKAEENGISGFFGKFFSRR